MEVSDYIWESKINLTTTEINISDKCRWDDLLLSSPNASYRQTFEYEYSGREKGRKIATFVFSLDGSDVAGAHYSIRKASKLPVKVADILNGIVFKGEPDADLLEKVLAHFEDWAASQGAAMIRYYPWLPLNIGSEQSNDVDQIGRCLDRKSFKPLIPGRHTYWIDITKSDDDILGAMKKQTRYDVRSAIKSNLEVVEQRGYQPDEFEKFWTMYASLAQEKQFDMLSKEQMLAEIRPLLEVGFASMFFIRYNGVLVNATLASTIGQGAYLYGAINPSIRELEGCPPIGAAAQWTMITAMKQKGLKIFDMGFCPGPEPIKEDPRYNIWRFKHGFGGAHVQFMPVYGKIIRAISGRLFKIYRYGFDKKNTKQA